MAPTPVACFIARALSPSHMSDVFEHVGARRGLLARDISRAASNEAPGRGTVNPHDINNGVMFGLFGVLGAAVVLAVVWFFFWAKNGGFHFKKNDWEEYKSTVLRRKGPNGTILSGATPSTQLGGGSVYKDYDGTSAEDTSTVVTATTGLSGITGGVSDFIGREKRRKKREEKARKKASDREHRQKRRTRTKEDAILVDEEAEEEAKQHLRSYRHEKSARVGGLNKESEGSAWDGSTNPSHSTMSDSDRFTEMETVSGTGTSVTSGLISHRERMTVPSSPKKSTPRGGGIRKVYSTTDKTTDRESERARARGEEIHSRGRRDFSWQRAGGPRSTTTTRTIEEEGASTLCSRNPSRDPGTRLLASAGSPSVTDTGTGSDLGTKVYQHNVHIPGTSTNDFAYSEAKRKKRAQRRGERA